MMNYIWSAIVGLIVGVIAEKIYSILIPGSVHLGMLKAMLIGILGSLLAGYVAHRGQDGFHRAGFLSSILGAMVLIFVARMLHIGG